MEETTWSALGAPGSVAMREKAGLLPDRHEAEDEVDGDVDEDGVELDGKGLLIVRATMTLLVAGSWSLEAGPGAGAAGDCTSCMAGKAGYIVEKTKSSRCCWFFHNSLRFNCTAGSTNVRTTEGVCVCVKLGFYRRV